MADLKSTTGRVTVIIRETDDLVEFEAECTGGMVRAVCYPSLTGPVKPGDTVLLNTTAVELDLGSGGRHFVIANLDNPETSMKDAPGHVMKMRYTPMQCRVLSAEEEGSEHRQAVEKFKSLDKVPVIIGELHSMLAPVCAAAYFLASGTLKIVYIMSDTASLPIAFSRTVRMLKKKELIYATITCGQAFGGDAESVNKYSALAVAKDAYGADIIVCCPGIGVVGTGTTLGCSSLEVGEWINAVAALGGSPVVVPRISFAEARERHRGLSHHAITALKTVALAGAVLPLPELPAEETSSLNDIVSGNGIGEKHNVITTDGTAAIDGMKKYDMRITTMGRGVEEDPAFFLACGAAANYAVSIIEGAAP